jgi:hypothetical protein
VSVGIERTDELLSAMKSSLEGGTRSLIDCQFDDRENEKPSQALGEVICRADLIASSKPFYLAAIRCVTLGSSRRKRWTCSSMTRSALVTRSCWRRCSFRGVLEDAPCVGAVAAALGREPLERET